MGDSPAFRLSIPEALFHDFQASTDLWLHAEQADGVEQRPQLEREVTADGFVTLAKAEPLLVVHGIDEDSVSVIPEDPVPGVPGSIILDDFEDTVACLFSSALPEVEEGLVDGVLGEE